MPFWPEHLEDPIYDPPRRPWDEWGPQEQERVLREKIGDELFDYLDAMERRGRPPCLPDDGGRTKDGEYRKKEQI